MFPGLLKILFRHKIAEAAYYWKRQWKTINKLLVSFKQKIKYKILIFNCLLVIISGLLAGPQTQHEPGWTHSSFPPFLHFSILPVPWKLGPLIVPLSVKISWFLTISRLESSKLSLILLSAMLSSDRPHLQPLVRSQVLCISFPFLLATT